MKRMLFVAWMGVVVLGLGMLLGGCTPAADTAPGASAPSGKSVSPADQVAQKAKAKTKKQDAKKKQAKKKAVKKAPRNLASNGAFQEWDGNVLKGWKYSPADRIAKSSQGAAGTSVTLNPDAKLPTILVTPIKGDLAGRKIAITVKGKSSDANMFGFRFEGKAGGKEFTSQYDHPGNGELVSMSRTVAIPKDFEKGSGELRIFLRKGATAPANVESAAVFVR